jgi:hypothetical protein
MSSSLVGSELSGAPISPFLNYAERNPMISNTGVCGSIWLVPLVVEIDVTCHLESFRRFLISSTCRSFIPESYLRDSEVFPEKEMDPGSIYIEAADKVTLKKIRDITFVNAREILGIIYTSKSGNSKLKWRQLDGPVGRITGEASPNSLVNMSMARIISPQDVEEIMRNAAPASEEGPVEAGAQPEGQSMQATEPPIAQASHEGAGPGPMDPETSEGTGQTE